MPTKAEGEDQLGGFSTEIWLEDMNQSTKNSTFEPVVVRDENASFIFKIAGL